MQPTTMQELERMQGELLARLREGAGRLSGGKPNPNRPDQPPVLRPEDARAMLADAESALERVTRARQEVVARYDEEIAARQAQVKLLRERLDAVLSDRPPREPVTPDRTPGKTPGKTVVTKGATSTRKSATKSARSPRKRGR